MVVRPRAAAQVACSTSQPEISLPVGRALSIGTTWREGNEQAWKAFIGSIPAVKVVCPAQPLWTKSQISNSLSRDRGSIPRLGKRLL